MKDDVPEEEKKRRVDEVMELQAGISEELNLNHIGREFKVMIDRCEGGFWIGRTEFDSPDVDNEVRIAVSDDYHLRIGDFVQVKVTGATAFDLDAEVLLDGNDG
jgi:ribosomal protein S12 methylthiotransferase